MWVARSMRFVALVQDPVMAEIMLESDREPDVCKGCIGFLAKLREAAVLFQSLKRQSIDVRDLWLLYQKVCGRNAELEKDCAHHLTEVKKLRADVIRFRDGKFTDMEKIAKLEELRKPPPTENRGTQTEEPIGGVPHPFIRKADGLRKHLEGGGEGATEQNTTGDCFNKTIINDDNLAPDASVPLLSSGSVVMPNINQNTGAGPKKPKHPKTKKSVSLPAEIHNAETIAKTSEADNSKISKQKQRRKTKPLPGPAVIGVTEDVSVTSTGGFQEFDEILLSAFGMNVDGASAHSALFSAPERQFSKPPVTPTVPPSCRINVNIQQSEKGRSRLAGSLPSSLPVNITNAVLSTLESLAKDSDMLTLSISPFSCRDVDPFPANEEMQFHPTGSAAPSVDMDIRTPVTSTSESSDACELNGIQIHTMAPVTTSCDFNDALRSGEEVGTLLTTSSNTSVPIDSDMSTSESSEPSVESLTTDCVSVPLCADLNLQENEETLSQLVTLSATSLDHDISSAPSILESSVLFHGLESSIISDSFHTAVPFQADEVMPYELPTAPVDDDINNPVFSVRDTSVVSETIEHESPETSDVDCTEIEHIMSYFLIPAVLSPIPCCVDEDVRPIDCGEDVGESGDIDNFLEELTDFGESEEIEAMLEEIKSTVLMDMPRAISPLSDDDLSDSN